MNRYTAVDNEFCSDRMIEKVPRRRKAMESFLDDSGEVQARVEIMKFIFFFFSTTPKSSLSRTSFEKVLSKITMFNLAHLLLVFFSLASFITAKNIECF